MVTVDAISAVEFPDLVRQFRVTGVPKTIINDEVDILGAVPETQFVEAVVGAPGGAPVLSIARDRDQVVERRRFVCVGDGWMRVASVRW